MSTYFFLPFIGSQSSVAVTIVTRRNFVDIYVKIVKFFNYKKYVLIHNEFTHQPIFRKTFHTKSAEMIGYSSCTLKNI